MPESTRTASWPANGPAAPLSPVQLVKVARAAGFAGAALPIAVAVALGESGGDPDRIGDRTLAGARTRDGRTWGPSIGLFQVRSIDEEFGTGSTRDASRLRDPAFNARSAFTLYKGRGGAFGDWTVYTAGIYKRFLPQATTAVGAAGLVDDYSGGNLDNIETITEGLNNLPGSGAVQALGAAITSPLDAAKEALRILQRIEAAWNRETAIRVLKIVGGMAGLILGAVLMSRDLFGSALSQVATPLAGAAAGAAA